jgi:hypothetical protein
MAEISAVEAAGNNRKRNYVAFKKKYRALNSGNACQN